MYMCRYRINQHIMVLKLDSVSVNKTLAPEFVTLKVSQALNLMQHSMSTQQLCQHSEINNFVGTCQK